MTELSKPMPPLPPTDIHWSWTMYGSRYGKSGGHFHSSLNAAIKRISASTMTREGRKRMGGEVYKLINNEWVLVASHNGEFLSDVKLHYDGFCANLAVTT